MRDEELLFLRHFGSIGPCSNNRKPIARLTIRHEVQSPERISGLWGNKMIDARKRHALRGTSFLALAGFLASGAQAACTTQNQSAECSGANSGPLTVDGVTVSSLTIDDGASVTGGSPAAVTMAPTQPSYYPTSLSLTVNGIVDGLSGAGVAVQNGAVPPAYYYPGGVNANITVGVNGLINGSAGIELSNSTGNTGSYVLATLSNSGSITASTGPALLATSPIVGGFVNITNTATGTIGGIKGYFGSIYNNGVIDGGTGSAIENGGSGGPYSLYGSLTNLGDIRSSGSSSTILYTTSGAFVGLTNSGRVLNDGNGLAIEAVSGQVTNNAGALIQTGGATAISASTAINLVNRGTVNGSILAGQQLQMYLSSTSMIDSTGGGIIDGDVTLGAGDDTVVATFIDGIAKTGITGTLDAGGGSDKLDVHFTQDATLSSNILLPSFEQLGLAPSNGAKITLANGFTATGPILLDGYGQGTLINSADLTFNGQAILAGYNGQSIDIINNGSITATASDPQNVAIQLSVGSEFTNNGTITVSGGAAVASAYYGSVLNKGSITATGTAVSTFASHFENDGTITSTGGFGVSLSQSSSSISDVNTGTIDGKIAGVVISNTILNNTGTIHSDNVAVGLSFYGGIYNKTSGVITGGKAAIANPNYPDSSFSYNLKIYNAGTINGDVNLGTTSFGYGSYNVFDAMAGGTLNGNLVLGSGNDVFVTDITNSGSGPYAGVTGTVSGSGSETIIYRVSKDTTSTISTASGPFGTLGYQLQDGAKLTLTAASSPTATLLLTGNGTVDLTADLNLVGTLLLSTNGQIYTLPGDDVLNNHKLTITSHGNLTFSKTDPNSYFGPAIALAASDSLVNTGTLRVSDTSGYPSYQMSAVAGGDTVTNSGSFILNGAIGIYGTREFDNSGTISHTGDGAATADVVNVQKIVNSGTIGLIDDRSASSVVIDNKAGGTIGQVLLSQYGGYPYPGQIGTTIINAGTINSDLTYGSGYGPDIYVNAGGHVTGNLSVTNGAGLVFVNRSTGTGVQGTFDKGSGISTYVESFAASGSYQLDAPVPMAFDVGGVEALGAGTTVTLNSSNAATVNNGIALYGDGTVVNKASIGPISIPRFMFSGPRIAAIAYGGVVGNIQALYGYGPSLLAYGGALAGFTNDGKIDGDIRIAARTFANTGDIHLLSTDTGSLIRSAADADFIFTNSGTITMDDVGFRPFSYYYYNLEPYQAITVSSAIDTQVPHAFTISNSGTIKGGLFSQAVASSYSFDNTGTITAPALYQANAVDLTLGGTYYYGLYYPTDIAATATLSNSGTISGGFLAHIAAAAVTLSNSGTITAMPPSGTGFLQGGLLLDTDTSETNTISVTNSGTISTQQPGGIGLQVISHARTPSGTDLTLPPVDGGPTTSITLTNSGTISGTGGNYIFADYYSGNLTANRATGLDISAEAVGISSVDVTNSGTIQGAGTAQFASNSYPQTLQPFSGDPAYARPTAVSIHADSIHLANAASAILTGDVHLDGGSDRVENYGRIDGNVTLASGDDRFVQGISATLNGTVEGGTGANTVLIDITGDGTFSNTLYAPFLNFQTKGITGTGTLALNAPLPFDSLMVDGGQLTISQGSTLQTGTSAAIIGGTADTNVTNQGTVVGSVTLGSGNDRLTNTGTITGNVDLGAGVDRLMLTGAGTFGGTVSGGSGTDVIELATTGTDAARVNIDLSRMTNFEMLQNSGGTNEVSGTVAFDQIAVTGGRLIGHAGSTINGAVSVVSGATFGSAGTVNGNIAVAGVLSPGASPGTMTINGNVGLAGGSNTFFEMTPTVSDAIVINGALTIAAGSTLTITGNRPLTPGQTYELITASGGISGMFSTVDKVSTVLGFVRQSSSAIELLGTIVLPASANRQAVLTTNYINGLLIAGTAPIGVINAIPSLLTANGVGNPATIARLSPEAYASASQMALENGLALAIALRSANLAPRGPDAAAFTFGQGFGDWRKLPGNSTNATSRANVDSSGVVGGIGYGTAEASFGGFVGYSHARQHVDAIGASNRANGIVIGATARGKLSGFDLSALVAYNGGHAHTTRTLASGAKAASRYRLANWTVDARAGYALAIGRGWSLQPAIGFTYVATHRGGASESGAGVFDLDVASRHGDATFVDGSVTIKANPDARVRPWLSLGVRHQLSGATTSATASLSGVAAGFTVPGVDRNRTLATLGGGLAAALTQHIDLFTGANGEIGKGGSSVSGNVGIRLIF
jgi:uncharacterized protein YhjY with autotransporter beta-barrel domain